VRHCCREQHPDAAPGSPGRPLPSFAADATVATLSVAPTAVTVPAPTAAAAAATTRAQLRLPPDARQSLALVARNERMHQGRKPGKHLPADQPRHKPAVVQLGPCAMLGDYRPNDRHAFLRRRTGPVGSKEVRQEGFTGQVPQATHRLQPLPADLRDLQDLRLSVRGCRVRWGRLCILTTQCQRERCSSRRLWHAV